MTVTWVSLGRPEQPIQHPWSGGLLNVSQREINIWRDQPDAIFNVVERQSSSGPTEYVLDGYELVDDNED